MQQQMRPLLEPPHQNAFCDDVLQGLQRVRKELSSKYLYDDVGSELFEQLCHVEEYYPTRTEFSIMQQYMPEIISHIGPNCLLIDYGNGSSMKTRLLLDALHNPVGYVAINIAKEQLLRSVASLAIAYPTLEIMPVCVDYTSEFALPIPSVPASRNIAYFLGTTIGNFAPEEATHFLQKIAKVCQGGGLLIGVDLKKDCNILHGAYNDRQGVTAQFNLHLLERINEELDADFQLDQFCHYAFYNPSQSRIEMHLVSLMEQTIRIGEHKIPFQLGESIWTESSYKYTLQEFAYIAASAGFTVEHIWTDPQQLSSVQYLATT